MTRHTTCLKIYSSSVWALSNLSHVFYQVFWKTFNACRTAGFSCHTQYWQLCVETIRDWQEYHIGPVNQKQTNKARGGMTQCELWFIKGCCSTMASWDFNRTTEKRRIILPSPSYQTRLCSPTTPCPKHISQTKTAIDRLFPEKSSTPTDYFCIVPYFPCWIQLYSPSCLVLFTLCVLLVNI